MTKIFAFSVAALLYTGSLAIAFPVFAQNTTGKANEPERWSILVTYGEDACPESTNGEIVVCAQLPEEERYRIPKDIRELEAEEEARYPMAWAAQFQNHEDEARLGRPNSCSVNGTNGFTGCQSAFMRRWFEERFLDEQEE